MIEHRLAAEPLRRGPLLAFRALEALTAGDAAALVALVEDYAAWLLETFGAGDGVVDAQGIPLLRGEALDAIWTNVVEDRDAGGAWAAVDGEWAFRGTLPLDYLRWRAVKDLPLRFRAEARGLDVLAVSGVDPARVALFQELEDAFHAAAGTGPTPTPSPRIAPYVSTEATRPRFRILASATEIITNPSLLMAYAETFATAPTTLVLVSDGVAAEPLAALQTTMATAGLDESTLPDTLLVDAGDHHGDAVLTTTGWGPPSLPQFGPADLDALRRLAGGGT